MQRPRVTLPFVCLLLPAFCLPRPSHAVTFDTPLVRSFQAGSSLNNAFTYGLAVGDINGDGKPDVVATSVGTNTVSVMLGNGLGNFDPGNEYPAGLSPWAVAIGDLNGDGRPDLVVANEGGNSVSVFLQNNTGGFQPRTDYPTGAAPVSLALADLNGDGKLDVVTSDSGPGTVSVLLGNGDGTLGARTAYGQFAIPAGLAVGDLNCDGIPDLVVADRGDSTASVLLGNGGGTFLPQASYPTGWHPVAVALGDLNGDGLPDLAVARDDSVATGVVLWGHPDGTLGPKVSFDAGPHPVAVAIGDLDGDLQPDLVFSDASTSKTVSVVPGFGGGGFGPREIHPVFDIGNVAPGALAVEDVNGDGRKDIVFANMSTSVFFVFYGRGAGSFTAHSDFTTASNPMAVAAGDFNGDGNPDLVTANYGSNSVSLLLGNGSGGFGPKTDFATGSQPRGIAVGDLNGDGKLDMVVANTSANSISIFLGNGSGGFGPRNNYPTLSTPRGVAVADLNGDGKPDVVVTDQGAASVSVFLGTGGGNLGTRHDFATGSQPWAVAVADFDRDGKPDLAVVNYSSGTLSLLMGNGDGTFGPKTDYLTHPHPVSVAAGDVNGDGYPDLALVGTDWSSVEVFIRFGSGFTGADFLTAPNPTGVVFGDFNGDSALDLAVACGGSDSVSVLLGMGDGDYGLYGIHYTSYPVASSPVSLVAADLNGDGVADLVTANSASNSVSALVSLERTRMAAAVTPPSIALGDTATCLGSLFVQGPLGAAPSGLFHFFDGNTLLATFPVSFDSIRVNPECLGSHSLTITYSGDSRYLGSISRVAVLAVHPYTFEGVVVHPMGGATLVSDGPGAFRVTGIGSSGADGATLVPPAGVSALVSHGTLPGEASLTSGAYLEISSRAAGSAPGDSLGFTRLTRLDAPNSYAVTGAIAGASEKMVAVFKNGAEVYRDRRPAGAALPVAKLVTCLACGLTTNDALGARALSVGSTQPVSPLLLRWQWADTTAMTVQNRPGGAPDTAVTGDELYIYEADPPAGPYATLAALTIRGKGLGEIRITSEESGTPVAAPAPPQDTRLWFAAPAPSPARGVAVFAFRLPRPDRVTLELLDVAGRRVGRRAPESFSAGSHAVRWQAPVGASGLYLVRLVTGSGQSAVRKWVVVR